MTISLRASSDGLSGTIQVGGVDKVKVDSVNGLVQTPPASATPAVNGELVFQLTSNTSLVIKVKGSDGTVRSTTLTLA